MKHDCNIEERILIAAKKVFLLKGYGGSKMRDIADEAEINHALLHYYFRCKENIYYKVFDDSILMVSSVLDSHLNNEALCLDERINRAISECFEVFLKEPLLIKFIIEEVLREPQKMKVRIKSVIDFDRAYTSLANRLIEEHKSNNAETKDSFSILLGILIFCYSKVLIILMLEDEVTKPPNLYWNDSVSKMIIETLGT